MHNILTFSRSSRPLATASTAATATEEHVENVKGVTGTASSAAFFQALLAVVVVEFTLVFIVEDFMGEGGSKKFLEKIEKKFEFLFFFQNFENPTNKRPKYL